ncbi:unnamed protein product [Auanema sp. JU1783]|nr:unnamed protein product [Auanema sp. JU1783]
MNISLTSLNILILFTLFSMTSAIKTKSKPSSSRSRSRLRFTKRLSQAGSIERTALFRSTILGLTAGYVSYQAGKHIISSPSNAMTFENRQYFWDSTFFTPSEELPTQCINKIDPNDPQLGRVYFPDESRPHEIVYGCPESELCCGYECCKENTFFTSLFTLLVMILVFSILGIFFIEAFRWALHCFYICKYGRDRQFEPLSI